MARGKRYRQAYEQIDRTRAYDPAEAVAILKSLPHASFDETVELRIKLGVNVRHAEWLRGTLALPRGLGKDVTIAVFAEGEQAQQATEAGAQFVGSDDLAERVEGGWTDFDVAIATPAVMPAVGKLGRVLGPQGLMPNPKVGTVTDDVVKAGWRRREPARSSTAPTAKRSFTSRSARRASTARPCSRTTPP